MKKMLVLGMIVVSGISFARDYEYRELSELKVIEEVNYNTQENVSRDRIISEKNIKTYSEFHRELESMSKRTDNK